MVQPLPALTMRENVMLGTFLRHPRRADAAARADQVLEFMGMRSRADQLASGLPLAQRKLLEVARAIGTGARLLLLDEVMAGLNPREAEQVVGLIKRLREFGITSVGGVEHIMRIVMSLASRVVVLDQGKKIRRGPAGRGGARPEGGGGLPGLEVRGRRQAMSEPLLRIQDVVAFYGDFQALFGVTFEVRPNEVLALLGGNGAGKTTCLRVISGLLRPRSGTVHFEGQDITRTPPDVIVDLGIAHVPEARQLFPEMTVEENLYLGSTLRRARGHRPQNLERMYSLFPRLGERRRQLAGTLSGGEQQMVAISRALMSEPKLLMLDEPSLGLSPKLTEQTLAAVREIAKSVTVLIVEQKVMEGLEISDRGYVIEHGQLVKEGSAAQLISDPSIREAYLGL